MYKIEKIYYKKNGGAEIKFSVINIEKCIMIKEFNKYEDAEAYIYYLLRDKS
ncbi:MAG: hypothetical protein PF487_13435 [Bacteroidales bacterium]|jgi:hypothetical protein|nr:hypothetical protein [Bacteroidales bacterium]